MSSYDLKRMFGCCSLNDWQMLEKTGAGLHVAHEGSRPLAIGNMAADNRNKHGKLSDPPKTALHTAGMDVSYGEGISPGGRKHALTCWWTLLRDTPGCAVSVPKLPHTLPTLLSGASALIQEVSQPMFHVISTPAF
jgi:hypothetical protein